MSQSERAARVAAARKIARTYGRLSLSDAQWYLEKLADDVETLEIAVQNLRTACAETIRTRAARYERSDPGVHDVTMELADQIERGGPS